MTAIAIGAQLAASAFVFIKAFSEQKKVNKKIIITIYSIAAILSALSLINGCFLDTQLALDEHGYQLQFYPAWIIYELFIAFVLIYMFLAMIRTLKNFKGIQHYQSRYLFLGILGFSCFVFMTGVVLPGIGENQYVVFNAFSILFFFLAISYAILRHRFLDATVFVKWSSVLGAVAMLLTGVYIVCLIVLERIVPQYFDITPSTLRVLVVALIALTLVPFRNIIRKFLLSLFLSREKELEQELDELKRFLLTQLAFEESVVFLISELESLLRVRCATIFMYDKLDTRYKVETSIGYEENIKKMGVKDVTPLFDMMKEYRRTTVKKWLDDGNHDDVVAMMESIDAELCIPMFFDDEVIGIIALSEKKWRKYTVDEIVLLEAFAQDAVIALHNALEVDFKLNPPKKQKYVTRPSGIPGWVIIDDPPPDGDDDNKR